MLGAVVVALGLVGVTGGYLVYTQREATAKLRHDFGQRAKIAASLTAGLLSSSADQSRSFAEASFSTPAAQLPAVVNANRMPGVDIAVLGPDGSVLASASTVLTTPAAVKAATASVVALARENGSMAFSDLYQAPDGPKFWMALPYTTAFGIRVFVVSVPVAQIKLVAGNYLASSLDVTGGQATVVDGGGATLLSTADAAVGRPIPDPAVVSALHRSSSGTVNGRSFVAVPVAGSRWNVVLVTSQKALLAPIQATKRVAWMVFVGFVAALASMLAFGAQVLVSSARLAHARLHDVLTGLPSRALFVAQAERAIQERASQGGMVAALFLDLDGFKPVNDTLGHAAGDALLTAVAARLRDSIRPDDLVSRFGGDEFLVLCKGLNEEREAFLVADRIQQRIREPFTIDGEPVSIGVSIGVATYDEDTAGATALIRNADLAMYHAKQGGRGRTERFTPELTQ